jgi:hypothetical protein
MEAKRDVAVFSERLRAADVRVETLQREREILDSEISLRRRRAEQTEGENISLTKRVVELEMRAAEVHYFQTSHVLMLKKDRIVENVKLDLAEVSAQSAALVERARSAHSETEKVVFQRVLLVLLHSLE